MQKCLRAETNDQWKNCIEIYVIDQVVDYQFFPACMTSVIDEAGIVYWVYDTY